MESLKPYFEIERPPCPFYGFNGISGSLMDTEGNHCALRRDYRPCVMEINEEEPNWNLCPIRQNFLEGRGKKLEEVAGKIQVFPREFRPPKDKPWKGISLKDWMNSRLNKK